MKKLTGFLGVLLSLAVTSPALADDGLGGPDRLAAAAFAPRDDGDDTDTTPPPEDDGVTDPAGDPPPESP